MGTCGSSSVQSCLTGSARLCSKQDGTARAGSSAQHKSLMGRTRKSMGQQRCLKWIALQESYMWTPTVQLMLWPHRFLLWTIVRSLLSLRLQVCMSWLLATWRFCYVGGSEVLRTLLSEELFDFVCIQCFFAYLVLIFLNRSPKPNLQLD